MNKIIITIEADTQFHNGQDYNFYPSLEISITDESGNQLFVHSCRDIHDANSYDNIEDAQVASGIFLSGNVKAIGRAIVSEVNE